LLVREPSKVCPPTSPAQTSHPHGPGQIDEQVIFGLLMIFLCALATVSTCFIEEYNMIMNFVSAEDLDNFESCWRLLDPSRQGYISTWYHFGIFD